MKRQAIALTLGLIGCAGPSGSPETSNTMAQSEADISAAIETPSFQAQLDSNAVTASVDEIWSPLPEPAHPEIEADEVQAEGSAPAIDNSLSVAEYSLRRGESLAHFARWSGLTVESIADSSGLTLNGTYPVGTKLILPLTAEELANVETGRDAHHVKRVEGYLASRGGSAGSEFYQVQSGDTAWVIARSRFGIPVWLLESYNPSADLEHLRPGQELMVPVIDDVVVSAD